MAPAEKLRLPFRWQFLPLEEGSDRAIRWKWRAFTQGGNLVLESDGAFETLTECIADARTQGYGSP